MVGAMKPVFQTHFDEFGSGPGNCMQAVAASVLELPLTDVPNFVLKRDAFKSMRMFFALHGYDLIERPASARPKGLYFVTGTSTQGHEHIVVYQDGKLVHDPNPHGGGLKDKDGVFQIRRQHDMQLRGNVGGRKLLRAIYANAGVQDWYYDTLNRALAEAHADAVMMLTTAYAEPAAVGIKVTTDAPAKVPRIDAALKKWGDKWQKKFNRLSRDVSKAFAKRSFAATDVAMRAALKDAGFTVSFKPTRKSLESYKLVVADNVGLIRNLQQSLYSKIQQDVWASVRRGGDMNTLSAKLQKSYGIEAKRAALIARDQNAKAKAVLESTRRQELGITKAIWQHSGGGKEPRPVHLKWGEQGKVFDLNKGLWDPEEHEFVLPGTLINCRCTSRAIIPGLEDDD